MRWRVVAALLPVAAALDGCVVAPPPGPVAVPPVAVAEPAAPVGVRPPPPVAELVPVAPSARYVWRPGHWRWTRVGWVWVRGRYVVRLA